MKPSEKILGMGSASAIEYHEDCPVNGCHCVWLANRLDNLMQYLDEQWETLPSTIQAEQEDKK